MVGKKQVRVDPTSFETALPNVFAAGDVAHYEGKITLITIGLGRGGDRRQPVRGPRARREAAARLLHGVGGRCGATSPISLELTSSATELPPGSDVPLRRPCWMTLSLRCVREVANLTLPALQ